MKKPVQLIFGLCLVGCFTASFADSLPMGCGLFPNQPCQLQDDILANTHYMPADGYHHGGNHETNLYLASQVTKINNELILSAKKAPPGVYTCNDNNEAGRRACDYISGWIETKGKWSTAGITHGYVEVSATMPVSTDAKNSSFQGMWPAIWMLPNNVGAGWPTHGEIDIAELHGQDSNAVLTTLHYGDHAYATQYGDGTFQPNPLFNYVSQDHNFGKPPHTFGLEWNFEPVNPYVTTWYDGKPVVKRFLKVKDKTTGYWIFDTVFGPGQQNGGYYLILNIATGGSFGPTTPTTSNGSGDPQNPLLQMRINSIKSYKLQ